jgi:sugar/nucleoside kinase (ribokinase family)
LTLSDSFCVERFLHGFRALVADSIDILLGNRDELCLLYEADDVEVALERAGRDAPVVAVTLGADGAAVSGEGSLARVPASPVAHVVDTTGAGDLFAAGFLFGLTHGHDVATSARIGGIAAAEVISHVGARPLLRLADLLG